MLILTMITFVPRLVALKAFRFVIHAADARPADLMTTPRTPVPASLRLWRTRPIIAEAIAGDYPNGNFGRPLRPLRGLRPVTSYFDTPIPAIC
jgi:hypothetical protein